MENNVLMTPAKRLQYEYDAETINFWRNNPCIAAEELLGVQLLDVQKYLLQQMWNCPHVVMSCSRNLGKSFICAVFCLLKALLYEDLNIYLLGSVGAQSAELFSKIEQIVRRSGKTAASIRSLKDIAEKETVKNASNKTGFSHSPSGFEVHFYNGSMIATLNSNPDNNRSRRADIVIFDESAFASTELLVVAEAFATQSSDFATSTDAEYNPDLVARKCPTQLIYASSQDSMQTLFYKHFKDFAKRMLIGDRNYFVADLPCTAAINTFMNGEPYLPLLTQDKVDSALRANKEKALREFYNKPTMDGGDTQIVKWATIRRNEKFYLPQLSWKPDRKYILTFDPSRTQDNSICLIMAIYKDPDYGWCGDLVNCVNFLDVNSENKLKLDSNRQLAGLRELLLAYNGPNPDYEYIGGLYIDQGAGGGGTSTYADGMLNNWEDKSGATHRGLIDANHEIYSGYTSLYPDAVDKLRLISPRKFRTAMVGQLIELLELGVIRFPYEYNGNDYVTVLDEDGEPEVVELSIEQQVALQQLDLVKAEITSIQKYKNADGTSITYALSKEKQATGHDDRFYAACLAAKALYEIRRTDAFEKTTEQNSIDEDEIFVTELDFTL